LLRKTDSVSLSQASDFPGFSSSQRATSPQLYNWDSVVSFSSVGPTADGRRAPILIAPGVAVLVAHAFSGPETPAHDDYEYASGTSFSAPAVAGLAALIDEFFLNTTGVRASAAMKMAALIATARTTSRVVEDLGDSLLLDVTAPPDISYGVPLLNLSALYFLAGNTNGTRYSYCLVASSADVSVALAWLDPPAYPGSPVILVNDLNLYAYNNDTEYTLDNHLDNTEKVSFVAAPGSVVRIVVDVTGIISNYNQSFAVVTQGASGLSECGTCLYSDEASCAEGEVWDCSGETGVATCVVAQCSSGHVYNGSVCVSVVSSESCLLSHGGGLIVGGICEVQYCDANYILQGNGCACLPELPCGAVCANNEFGSCPSPETFPVQYVYYESPQYTAWRAAWLSIVLILFVIVIIALVGVCATDPPRKPPAAKQPLDTTKQSTGGFKNLKIF